jgi:hypothetical protein
MRQEVIDQLNQQRMTPFHEALLNKCVKLVNESRQTMGKNYAKWDERARVYSAEHIEDEEDRRSKEDKEPAKMLIPFSAAQVNTFIAYCFMLFYQRPNFFEFLPTGSEDYEIRDISERSLNKDLSANKFELVLYQFLLDIARFGLGVFKHGWVEETVHVLAPTFNEVEGEQIQGDDEYQEFPSFIGNKIVAISPYYVFPDCRLPLTRHQEGEFCASDDEVTMMELQAQEARGEVAGIKFVEPLTASAVSSRGKASRFVSINKQYPDKTSGLACRTECQIKIIPNKFELDDGKMLGDEDFPVMYNVQYVNDQRIISVEPANNFHSEFTYDLAQFTPDQHYQINKSLADQIGPIQEVMDWFINSRIAAVKRTLENNLVVDPTGVDMTTVTNRSPIILLRRQIGRGGIDRFIKPLPVIDATGGHMNDVSQLSGIMQTITGVNEMALGKHSTGRRSATQDRAVAQGSSMRLTTECKLIWIQAIEPMGKKLLINQRQNISPTQFFGLLGDKESQDPQSAQQLFMAFKSSAFALIAQNDFFVFDGTLPSDKQFLAQSLQELAQIAMANPQAALELDIDMKKLLKEIYALRGVNGILRFQLTPEERQQKQQEMLMQQMLLQQQGNGNIPAA